MQQCRSIIVHVSSKPELRLDPPSATVYRSDSVRIRCLSSDIDQSNGYSWTKNNALFQSKAENELWEDLYPDGSILKINNIQVIYIHYKLSAWFLHPLFSFFTTHTHTFLLFFLPISTCSHCRVRV